MGKVRNPIKEKNEFLKTLQGIVLGAAGSFEIKDCSVVVATIGSATLKIYEVPSKKSHQNLILTSCRRFAKMLRIEKNGKR